MTWGGEVTVSVEHRPLLAMTDAQRGAIAAALGVEPGSEHVEAVRWALTCYVARGPLTGGDHRAADVETLQALAQAMDGLNPNVARLLARHGAAFECDDPGQVAAAAREAVVELGHGAAPKRGRPRQWSRDALLSKLRQIFTEATGQEPTRPNTWETMANGDRSPSGRFFAFMKAVRAMVPELAVSDQALTEAVLRE